MRNLSKIGTLLLLVIAVVACSGQQLEREAQLSEHRGDWDRAVLEYLELLRKDPGNLSYRSGLLRAKIQASHLHFEAAKNYRDAGVLERALLELQEAVQLDPTNQYAFVELRKIREELAAERNERDPVTSLDTVKEKTRGALAQPPVLNPRSNEPIDLDFPEPVSVMNIYRALGKAFGINVLFDPKMRDEELSITLSEVTAQDALEILIRTAGHFYKVLDEHSIIIVPDTTQNRRAYTDLIIQTFFLSNSEVAQVITMLRTLIDSRKIAPNERLNAIVLRDSADKVKVAERLIAANDKARAEVVVDVELLQVDTNKLRQVGLSVEPRTIGFSLDGGSSASPDGDDGGTGGGAVRFSDLEFIDSSNWFLTVPTFLIDFVKDQAEAQTLARPQVRISEGEKASLVIADQVPIPVTSFNTANTVGSNIVPITSFQYQDVGITIEIEPRVHHNNEVSLNVRVEVSNIAGNVGQQPIIGTREISTTIRLRDGETNFLAGLIRTDEAESEEGVAGLSEIPLIGRLFSRKRTENKRTDIVLTLTPHIIRRADITEDDLLPIWVGTETNFSFRGGSPALESLEDGPFDAEDERDAAIERRRERLQQLPRNLRRQGEEDEGQTQPPAGIELAPSSSPARPPSASLEAPSDLGIAPASFEALAPAEESVRLAATPGEERAVADEPVVELSLAPEGLIVDQGQEFSIGLDVDSVATLSHLSLRIGYDSELLELVGTTEGDFLGDVGEAHMILDSSEPGRIAVGASRLGHTEGVNGRGMLLELHFRALRYGEGDLSFVEAETLNAELATVGPLRVHDARIVVADPQDLSSGRGDGELEPARPGEPSGPERHGSQ